MVEYISYAFLASSFGLGGWILSGDNKSIGRFFGALFYLSIAGYIGMVLMQSWSTPTKVLTLGRDAIILSGFSMIIMAARKIKILPYIIMATFGFNVGLISDYFKEHTPFKLKSIVTEETNSQKAEATEAMYDNKGLSESGELLVELRNKESIVELEDITKQYDLELKRAFNPADENVTKLDEYFVINIPNKQLEALDQISKELSRTSKVIWVEPNEQLKLDVEPGTPSKPKHKCNHVNDPLDSDQWMHEALEMDKYYGLLNTIKTSTKRSAKLYILDSGVDAAHEDIADSYSSLNESYDTDANGHGTHCAGVAAATTNNGKGIASFSIGKEFVEVTGVKVMSSLGFGSQKMIIDGMIEAVDNGADIISMSLGGVSNQSREKAYNEAVKYATDKGCLVIVAAGNSSMDAARYSPANSRGVIAVAATDENSLKSSFTNTVENIRYGISAPGVNIVSTMPNGEYKALSGTSMATPHVAGLVAVMKSIKPDITVEDAFRILNKTGKEVSDHHQIGKLIQPYQAVKLLLEEMVI